MDRDVLVWGCDFGCGGLGDRIVGLVTCSIIAEISNRRFLIDWKSPSIDGVISILPEYNYSKVSLDWKTPSIYYERWIDRHRTAFVDRFKNHQLEDEWSQHRIVHVKNNQPYHLLLWSDPNLASRLPNRDAITRHHYQKVFTEYLIPLFHPNRLLNVDLPTIAVHMRFGDWTYNYTQVKTQDELNSAQAHHSRAYGLLLRSLLKDHFGFKVRLILLTDANAIIVASTLRQVLDSIPGLIIETTTAQPGHLDLARDKSKVDLVGILNDLSVIGQCNHVIFWDNTNFARVGILTSRHSIESIWMFRTKSRDFIPITSLDYLVTKDPNLLGYRHDHEMNKS